MLFMRWVSIACAVHAAATIPDILHMTIDDAIAGFANGSFTSVQLTTTYLARIQEVNGLLNAVIETNPDALAIAEMADTLRANGTVLGPLHGVPILIKDNIATFDQMNNTAGSYSLLGATVPRDSTLVTLLRQAGAIILGKTNLSQWANYRSTNSSNGWSARGGQTYGAWHYQQDPSGSSSGSGVSASIALSLGTLGSETDGSIVSPSQQNGVVGLKPTVGLTSRSLVIPISSHQDTVGPITRTVKDAAYILQAIAGYDPSDNYTALNPFAPTNATNSTNTTTTLPDYVAACRLDGLSGVRVGIPRQLFNSRVNPFINASFTRAIDTVRSLGAVVIDNAQIPSYSEFIVSDNETIVLDADFKPDLANYFGQLVENPNNVTTLAGLINYTRSDPREEFPSRNIAIFEEAQALNFTIDSAQGQAAVQANIDLGSTRGILGALEAINGTVLMLPTDFASTIAAIAGYPILTIPLGYAPRNTTVVYNRRNSTVTDGPGVPYGISFLSRRFDEEALIAAGYAFEQATKVADARRPIILPNTQISDIQSEEMKKRRRRRV